MAGWTAVNNPGQSQHALNEDKRFTIEDDQAYALHMETGVYMKDAKEGSWSGKLPRNQQSSDEEIGNVIAMNDLRQKVENANAQLRTAEQRTADVEQAATILLQTADNPDPSDGEEDHTQRELRAREKDEELRRFIGLIKMMLSKGCIITLQHTGAHDVDEDMTCMHPYCTSDDRCIAAHSYYLTVTRPDCSTNACRYCLTCSEAMWNGKLQIGELPDPRVQIDAEGQRDAQSSSMQESTEQEHYGMCLNTVENHSLTLTVLSGTNYETGSAPASDYFTSQRRDSVQPRTDIPASLLSSKHAPRPDEVDASQADQRPQIQSQLGAMPSISSSAVRFGSPAQPSSSTNKSQDIKFALTRFQHLAHLIEPGNGLNEVEKAVLAVWRAATKQQFGWRATGRFPAPPREEKVAVGDGECMDLDRVEEMVGLSRVQCFGKDLSEALELVAARQDL